MEVMGYIGNFYVMLLFLFLLGGAGTIAFNFSQTVWNSTEKFIDQRGGKLMGNKWIKLAVTSFVGILVASFALGLTNTFSGQDPNSAHNHGGQATGQMNMSPDQMGGMAGVNGINGMNGMSGMSGMGAVNGQMSNVQGYGGYDVRLYQLQMNMMQLQQQMNQLIQMNMNQPMNQPMNPGMGNMNSMNNMNNMSNMSGSSQGNSGGGMSMM